MQIVKYYYLCVNINGYESEKRPVLLMTTVLLVRSVMCMVFDKEKG